MRFVITTDAGGFADLTRSLLEGRLECNVLATVLLSAQEGVYAGVTPRFAYGLDAEGRVAFAALRTPPWAMLVTELEPGLAPELLDAWLAEDPDPPGVSGLPGTARAIAAAWCERTGGAATLRMRQALHSLEQATDPPRPAPGELRLAAAAERELLVHWWREFVTEAGIGDEDRAGVLVDARLARGGLWVWDDGGPVSCLGVSPPIAGVSRIGPVYTPPERRRRGYAGTAVAAVGRALLNAGEATRLILYTDLANPTSNKIYFEVGYRRIADWEEYDFALPG